MYQRLILDHKPIFYFYYQNVLVRTLHFVQTFLQTHNMDHTLDNLQKVSIFQQLF